MYSANGEDIFVVDGHMHFWDAGPDNHKNDYGNAWIKCFYDYHSALSPADYVWDFDKYCNYGEEALVSDMFLDGYVDVAILNSTYLYEFFKTGFNTHQKNNVVKQKYPDRFRVVRLIRPPRGGGWAGPVPRDDGRVPHRRPEAVHRRVARRLQGLEAKRPLVIPLPGACPRTGHQERARPTRGRPSTR